MPIKRRGDCSSWERKPKCGFLPCTLSPRYGRGCDRCWRKAPILTLALGGYLRPGGGAAGKILQETIDPETGGVFGSRHQHGSAHVAGVAALVKAEGIKEPDEVFSVLMKSARFSKMILSTTLVLGI